MAATTEATFTDEINDLKFVSLVVDKNMEKLAVISAAGKHFYYGVDGLRNLQSRMKLEDRIELNSIISLLAAAQPHELFMDLDAEPNLVSRDVSNDYER